MCYRQPEIKLRLLEMSLHYLEVRLLMSLKQPVCIVVHGILTRIVQSTSRDELIVTGVSALQHEAQPYKIKASLLGQVLSQAQSKARERKESNVERGLDKASQVIDK